MPCSDKRHSRPMPCGAVRLPRPDSERDVLGDRRGRPTATGSRKDESTGGAPRDQSSCALRRLPRPAPMSSRKTGLRPPRTRRRSGAVQRRLVADRQERLGATTGRPGRVNIEERATPRGAAPRIRGRLPGNRSLTNQLAPLDENSTPKVPVLLTNSSVSSHATPRQADQQADSAGIQERPDTA